MRSALMIAGCVAMLAALLAVECALWAMAPERRILRSAVMAGLVVGRVAAGVAW